MLYDKRLQCAPDTPMRAATATSSVNTSEHFVEQQATLLRSMAQRMLEGPQRLLEQQEALLAVIKSPDFQGDNLEVAFQLLTETAAHRMRVSRVGIWRYNDTRDAIRCLDLYELGKSQHSSGVVLGADRFPNYFDALSGSEAICADDARKDLRTHEFRDVYLDPLGIKSMMDIPLILFGRLEGVLCHEQIGEQRPWLPEDRLFAMAIANLAALAMERCERNRVAQQLRFDEAQRRTLIEERLRQSEERYRSLVNNLKLVVFQTDTEGAWTFLNPAWEDLTGFSVQEGLMANLQAFVHPEDRVLCDKLFRDLIKTGKDCNAELRIVTRTGEVRWVDGAARPIAGPDGRVTGSSGTFTDITERKATDAHIQKLAYHDMLTGLPNRTLLLDRLDRALVDAKRNCNNVAVLFIDLDNFKVVNDTHGHDIGDLLLMQLGARLKGLLREGDTVARFGGDEFLLVIPSFQVTEDVMEVAHKTIRALSEPFLANAQALQITASVGISLYPKDAGDRDTLLKHADIALYRAKSGGRNSFQFFG